MWLWYNLVHTQGSYIGNTTASQAVKAGSIPVPCSKKVARQGDLFIFAAVCSPDPIAQKPFDFPTLLHYTDK